MKAFTLAAAACLVAGGSGSCFSQSVTSWLTSADKAALIAPQASPLTFAARAVNGLPTITVNPAQRYQSIDGFGFALTGGSAQGILSLPPKRRTALLREMFAPGSAGGIGISYLRVSIGSSDLNDHTFSYDDLPEGQTDKRLARFSLAEDDKNVVPVLKEILAISPHIAILGSPWSAPIWMKTNRDIQGGMLQDRYYPVYASYLAKYVTGMKERGIPIDAITVQNEPFNDGNTPSMQMLAKQEARFIANNLGPRFKSEGIKTKIVLYDHNCDAPEYPISILTDSAAKKYVAGSGFHLYAGRVAAMTTVHDAFPDRGVYFTEQMVTDRDGAFDVAAPVSRVVIGATRNWSRNVILWNLAANSKFEPHTNNGGCTMCQGAVTIDGGIVGRNVAYYTIAHFSKFVPPGSIRIASTEMPGALPNVAFHTPDNKTVLIVANNTPDSQTFNIDEGGKTVQPTLGAGSVATYVW